MSQPRKHVVVITASDGTISVGGPTTEALAEQLAGEIVSAGIEVDAQAIELDTLAAVRADLLGGGTS